MPDAILYLRCDVEHLIPRVLNARGFDYWESGMDFLGYPDYYISFIKYQKRMRAAFNKLAKEYGFKAVDATRSIHDTFLALRDAVQKGRCDLKPEACERDRTDHLELQRIRGATCRALFRSMRHTTWTCSSRPFLRSRDFPAAIPFHAFLDLRGIRCPDLWNERSRRSAWRGARRDKRAPQPIRAHRRPRPSSGRADAPLL